MPHKGREEERLMQTVRSISLHHNNGVNSPTKSIPRQQIYLICQVCRRLRHGSGCSHEADGARCDSVGHQDAHYRHVPSDLPHCYDCKSAVELLQNGRLTGLTISSLR